MHRLHNSWVTVPHYADSIATSTVNILVTVDIPEIIGARHAGHLEKIKKIGSFSLAAEDIENIVSVLDRAPGPGGPVFGLERNRTGPHGKIMKYNLNRDLV